jgi:hypothetical protein
LAQMHGSCSMPGGKTRRHRRRGSHIGTSAASASSGASAAIRESQFTALLPGEMEEPEGL